MTRGQRRWHRLIWLLLAPLALGAAWYGLEGRHPVPYSELELER